MEMKTNLSDESLHRARPDGKRSPLAMICFEIKIMYVLQWC